MQTKLTKYRILFMREYSVIDSAPSIEKLRMRLKENELEQYGEAFTPDFVYNVINRLPRFSTMRVSS
jgi:ubiquitin carboxyl-terminal hydrolase 10